MKDTEYAYAVASVRAQEAKLLTPSDLEQMIGAANAADAARVLSDRGWTGMEDEDPSAFQEQLEGLWEMLAGILPEKHLLDFLLVKQDFHNAKAALKGRVTGVECAPLYLGPCLVDPALLTAAVNEKRFDRLPDWLAVPTRDAYDLLTRTLDGQLCDVFLDRAGLEVTLRLAKETKNSFLIKIAQQLCLTADLKIALRAARTKKDETFLEAALADCADVSKSGLTKASARGEEALLQYLEASGFGEAAAQIKTSNTAFEKWCDDLLMRQVSDAKRIAFGVEPLLAYYIAGEAQIKNARIILSMKRNGLPPEQIRERVRALYV